MALKTPSPTLQELAAACLQHLVENPEQLAEFMSHSGLNPTGLRTVIGSTQFEHGVIDYVVSNEPLLLAVCARNGFKPEMVMQVWARQHMTEH